MSLLLLATGIVIVGLFLPIFLDFISSNVSFLDIKIWLLFGVLTIAVRFNVFCCAICAIGNDLVYYWNLITAALISVTICLININNMNPLLPVLCTTLPIVLCTLNKPFSEDMLLYSNYKSPINSTT